MPELTEVGERGASPVISNNQRAGLDEVTLGRVAEQTGGEYFYAQETDTWRASTPTSVPRWGWWRSASS